MKIGLGDRCAVDFDFNILRSMALTPYRFSRYPEIQNLVIEQPRLAEKDRGCQQMAAGGAFGRFVEVGDRTHFDVVDAAGRGGGDAVADEGDHGVAVGFAGVDGGLGGAQGPAG